MSSLALPPRSVPRPSALSFSNVFERRGVDVLVVVAVLGLAAGLLAYLPGSFSVDSWLGLVTGREVWQSGIPHHEVLTSLSHSITWIDQQWLSQLAMYAEYRLGGLGLVGIINVALLILGVGGAVFGARRLGATPRTVLLALPLSLWLIVPSHEVRTQAFAVPLFVATAFLLAKDSRAPSRRVYWCLPILVLWGNLHGTVVLGAALVGLRGLTVAWERRKVLLGSARQLLRPVILAVGAPLCLLLTPYGLGTLSYYRTMFFGSSVMHAVSEWQPVTSAALIAVPFFIAAAIALWYLGHNPSRATLWEQLALLGLAAGSIQVIRNVLFFGLFALLVMPVVLDGGKGATGTKPAVRGRGAINAVLAGTALVAVLIGLIVSLARPAAAIQYNYQRAGLLTAVEQATRADPSMKVLADVRFADWLLWRDPALSGRVANDARWELLTTTQMNRLQAAFGVVGPDWKQGANGYRLIVLDRRYDATAVQAFNAEPGSRILYDDGDRIVILRSAREAA